MWQRRDWVETDWQRFVPQSQVEGLETWRDSRDSRFERAVPALQFQEEVAQGCAWRGGEPLRRAVDRLAREAFPNRRLPQRQAAQACVEARTADAPAVA